MEPARQHRKWSMACDFCYSWNDLWLIHSFAGKHVSAHKFGKRMSIADDICEATKQTAEHLAVVSSAEQRKGALSRRPQFMLIPSLACPAECSYCFGPHEGAIMSPAVLDQALDFFDHIAQETEQKNIKVTFHGGEPLTAGHDLWQQALIGLRSRFGEGGYKIALQSNLWLLDDEYCRMFSEHGVKAGTSLDGPRHITDHQRGEGYFDRTMNGIRLAHKYGIAAGCIATFTPWSAPRWREVFDFFLSERIGFSIHPAVPPVGSNASSIHLAPRQFGRLLCEMADHYIAHRREIAVSSLDQICKSLGCGKGQVCTFRDCLGMFFAIDPAGDIYPCQRLCGRPAWRLGNVADRPTMDDLLNAPVARRFAERESHVNDACRDCAHIAYCRGGCPYNAWAGNDGCIRDPYCDAYRELFDHLHARLNQEMDSEANMDAVTARPWDGRGHPLLKRGPLIELVREGPHPSQVTRTARRIVAAVELARGPDIPAVAARLVGMGVCRSQESAEASLAGLDRELHPEEIRLNNLYLHLTFRCQLECRHCYARATPHKQRQNDMQLSTLTRLLSEAMEVGFRQVVLTGGEPLMHEQRADLLPTLTEARGRVRPMNLVLRTNLAMPLSQTQLKEIALAVDQVVVSVDGDESMHDARRGRGAYAATVANLEAYQEVASRLPGAGELSLAAVMRADDIAGEPGASVRELARRLGVRRTRFRPLLPLGLAADWDEPPTSEALGGHADPMELIEGGFRPVSNCGLGQNLYVEPDGESFPCYAYCRPHSFLGNVASDGLAAILEDERFTDLCTHTVDTNPRCGRCDVRYLCGGACRGWGGERTQYDLDAPPPECDGVKVRAVALWKTAKEYLEIKGE